MPRIDEIFEVGLMATKDPKWIAWLQREVDVGNVDIRCVDLPAPAVDEAQISGRTDGHRMLCAQVATWLDAQGLGYSSRQDDRYYVAGIADVTDLSRQVFAECGYTDVFKILHGLSAGLGMIVAPYQEQPHAYVFRREKRLAFELWYEELRRAADAAAEAMFQNRP